VGSCAFFFLCHLYEWGERLLSQLLAFVIFVFMAMKRMFFAFATA